MTQAGPQAVRWGEDQGGHHDRAGVWGESALTCPILCNEILKVVWHKQVLKQYAEEKIKEGIMTEQEFEVRAPSHVLSYVMRF